MKSKERITGSKEEIIWETGKLARKREVPMAKLIARAISEPVIETVIPAAVSK